LLRVSLQRSLRSLPPFHGASGDEFMGGRSLEGWQGGRVFPPPVGGGPFERVLLQECPGGPRTTPPFGLGLFMLIQWKTKHFWLMICPYQQIWVKTVV
jgi:hypothetical protein